MESATRALATAVAAAKAGTTHEISLAVSGVDFPWSFRGTKMTQVLAEAEATQTN